MQLLEKDVNEQQIFAGLGIEGEVAPSALYGDGDVGVIVKTVLQHEKLVGIIIGHRHILEIVELPPSFWKTESKDGSNRWVERDAAVLQYFLDSGKLRALD